MNPELFQDELADFRVLIAGMLALVDSLPRLVPYEYIRSMRTKLHKMNAHLEAIEGAATGVVLRQVEAAAYECWHCKVALEAPSERPRCEDCPDNCDVEGCKELGCVAIRELDDCDIPY